MATLFTKITAESAGSSPYEFDAVNTAGSNTFAPSSAQSADGTYSYEAAFDGTSAIANAYESFSASDEIHITFKMYLSSDYVHVGTWGAQNLAKINDGQWHPLVRLAIASGGTTAPYRWYVTGTNITDAYNTAEVAVGEWLDVEMYWKYGAGGTGEYFVKINGTTIAEDTGLSFTYTTGDRLYMGGSDEYSRAASGSKVYYDEIEGFDTTDTGTVYDAAGVIAANTSLSGGVELTLGPHFRPPYRRGNDEYIWPSRWGMTNVAQYGRGYHSDAVVNYFFGPSADSGAQDASGIISAISGLSGSVSFGSLIDGVISAASNLSGTVSMMSFVDGAIAAISGMSGTLYGATNYQASGIISALSGTSGSALMRYGLSGSASAVSAASGYVNYWQSVSGAITALSNAAGSIAQRYGIIGAAQAVSGLYGDVSFIPGALQISGAITAVARVFQLFRYLNPQTAYSPIVRSVTGDSLVSTSALGLSGMSDSVLGDSGVVTGQVYYSLISTGVDR